MAGRQPSCLWIYLQGEIFNTSVHEHMIETSSRRMSFAQLPVWNWGNILLVHDCQQNKAANVCADSPRRTGALGVLAERMLLGKLLRAACK